MLLYALESLFKLRYQRCFTSLETITSHDAPEKIATWPRARIVHCQHIFGRSARYQDDDVSFGRPIHNDQFPPLLNRVLHSANRVPIPGKQVRIELISVIGGYVDVPRIRQDARKRRHLRRTRIGRSNG